MSLTLYQPNLPTASHPCGQSWHHTSNVDISLLLKPRDDNDTTTTTTSPGSPSRDRDPDRDPDTSLSLSTSTSPTDTSPQQPSQQQQQPQTSSLPPPTRSNSWSKPTTRQQYLQQQQQAQTQTQAASATLPASIARTTTTSTVIPAKRPASCLNPPPSANSAITRGSIPHPSPAKKQSKWSPYEDSKIISLRAEGMKWEDISRHLPGRSAISCRLHYQNYLERRSEWDEDRKDRLARLYERFKQEMWSKIADEMAIPWRAAEAMHWQIGELDMARRAGVTPFSLTTTSSSSTASNSQNGPGGGGGAGGNASRSSNGNSNGHSHHHHSRLSMSRLTSGEPTDSYPRMGAQQLPSLAELTAGLPAFTHPIQPLLPGPGYPWSDVRPPGTPYSSGLPYPGQMITPSPGDLRNSDYFLKRS